MKGKYGEDENKHRQGRHADSKIKTQSLNHQNNTNKIIRASKKIKSLQNGRERLYLYLCLRVDLASCLSSISVLI